MDIKDLKRLLDAVAGAEVNEFTLETGDYKLSLKRGNEVQMVAASSPSATHQPDPVAAPLASHPTAPAAAAPAGESAPDSHLVEITAPIVGTFYAAPAPDVPPYVKVGDRVEAGAVMCIIEAMKLMNEIEAESAGTVAEILVRNEEPVEYGQVLFRIDPG